MGLPGSQSAQQYHNYGARVTKRYDKNGKKPTARPRRDDNVVLITIIRRVFIIHAHTAFVRTHIFILYVCYVIIILMKIHDDEVQNLNII